MTYNEKKFRIEKKSSLIIWLQIVCKYSLLIAVFVCKVGQNKVSHTFSDTTSASKEVIRRNKLGETFLQSG